MRIDRSELLRIYIYIYIYICVCVCVCVYIYIYICRNDLVALDTHLYSYFVESPKQHINHHPDVFYQVLSCSKSHEGSLHSPPNTLSTRDISRRGKGRPKQSLCVCENVASFEPCILCNSGYNIDPICLWSSMFFRPCFIV